MAPEEAQDLLNINITPGGRSVYKREGYGLHKTLSISTAAVHGAHYFQDTSGSDIQLWASDRWINATVNGASPVQVATITVNATMQCTDSVGFAYCLTSSRDAAVRTSGTTGTTSFQSTIPFGTMVTNSPDRLLVAGVANNESTLYFSAANTFTNFTIGINSGDPFTEPILSPGSRITHVKYACGKYLWWKDGSFGYSIGSDQYNLEDVIISPTIGTLDNSSDEYNGHVYFRGQDNHIYDYDCANVTRLSRSITPTIAGSNRRKSNSWTQTSLSDFNGGSVVPSLYLSTASVSGDVTTSTFGVIETSSTPWNLGTKNNTTVNPSSITLSTNNSGNVADYDFENSTPTAFSSSWVSNNPSRVATYTGFVGTNCGSMPAKSGATVSIFIEPAVPSIQAEILSADESTTLATASIPYAANSCTWVSRSVLAGAFIGRRVKLRFRDTVTGDQFMMSNTFVLGGDIAYWTSSDSTSAGAGKDVLIDLITAGSSTITSGAFTSQTFDTSFTSSTVQLQTTWTANTSTPTFAVQHTSSTNTPIQWATLTTSTGTNSVANRYVRYVSTISIGSGDNALTAITNATLVARSSGSYYSAVNNASALTSWATFGANDGGNIAYFTRASTNSFTVLSSTPAWIAQSKNATVTASTGTFMQMRGDFTVSAATQNTSLNDFTFNWFEGTSADKAYIKYWNDYVWVSVSSGTSGLNNRVLRWDLLNETWLMDDIASNGFLVDNNTLYFGSPSVGKVYKYGSGLTTDDSGPITARWKSKDFMGQDPFVQSNYTQTDFVVKQASGTILAVTYTLDASSSTSYNLNLYDNGRAIIRKGTNLSSKNGTFYNIQFGDSSSNARWEVLGVRTLYTPLAWRPN